MRSIPVRTEAFEAFLCVALPEPRLVSQETGEVRKDRATGQSQYVVTVCAVRGRDSSVIGVTVAGEPDGLTLGGAVDLVDLEARSWSMDGRSGVSYQAESVHPAGSTRRSSAPRPGSSAASAYGSASSSTGTASSTSGGDAD